ncbi:hypothetical protein Btru_001639 [Bulinus truncatus]|nr:hypothetical protein Btru_001639 [Bulinus truncatus]
MYKLSPPLPEGTDSDEIQSREKDPVQDNLQDLSNNSRQIVRFCHTDCPIVPYRLSDCAIQIVRLCLNFSNIFRMNLQLVSVIFAVLVAVQLSDAHGGGPKRDKNETPRPTPAAPAVTRRAAHVSREVGGGSSEEHPEPPMAGDRFVWGRVLNENVNAHESAFVPSNSSVAIAKSVDRILRELNISGAISLINTTNTSQVEVIQVRDVCYLKDPSLTYQEYVDLLTARNVSD